MARCYDIRRGEAYRLLRAHFCLRENSNYEIRHAVVSLPVRNGQLVNPDHYAIISGRLWQWKILRVTCAGCPRLIKKGAIFVDSFAQEVNYSWFCHVCKRELAIALSANQHWRKNRNAVTRLENVLLAKYLTLLAKWKSAVK